MRSASRCTTSGSSSPTSASASTASAPTGVFSSWLMLATKSVRTASRRRRSVTSSMVATRRRRRRSGSAAMTTDELRRPEQLERPARLLARRAPRSAVARRHRRRAAPRGCPAALARPARCGSARRRLVDTRPRRAGARRRPPATLGTGRGGARPEPASAATASLVAASRSWIAATLGGADRHRRRRRRRRRRRQRRRHRSDDRRPSPGARGHSVQVARRAGARRSGRRRCCSGSPAGDDVAHPLADVDGVVADALVEAGDDARAAPPPADRVARRRGSRRSPAMNSTLQVVEVRRPCRRGRRPGRRRRRGRRRSATRNSWLGLIAHLLDEAAQAGGRARAP